MSGPCEPFAFERDPLWSQLTTYTIGPPDAALSFAARLARENAWDSQFTDRVIGEYKRFVFLAVRSTHSVTPSDAVDQAWHLHLTYTRDYWERFCPSVLGRDLHHGPTAGGMIEGHRYFEQYADTLASYEMIFGKGAPPDIWPAAAKRLNDDPQARRVHPRAGIIVPRWIVGITVTAITLLLIYLIWRESS